MKGDCFTVPAMKVGNSLYVRLPRSFVDQFNIKKGSKLMVMHDGVRFNVMPLRKFKGAQP